MQKGAKRILGALIVLIMVLSILPASVFATGETTEISDVLEGWSITLSDEIGVKFHLNSDAYTVTATVNGKEVTPTMSDDGKVVTVNVAAAQMTVPIVLKVDNGETVYTNEYSVREYAVTILEGEYAGYVKDMVKQMLNYGAAAQKYFNYNTESLANAGYELESNAQVPTEKVPEIDVQGSLEGIDLYGMSLVLESKTAVRFYFTGNVSGHKFKVGDTEYTPVAKSSMHFVEIDGINPQDLANAITLNVTDGAGGALSVTYSPMNYIVRMSNKEDSSDSMKSLVQALYGYHQEAVYYDSAVPVTGLTNHSAGWSVDSETGKGGLYIQTNAHGATYDSGWEVEYKPVSADAIKLIRNGETFDVAGVGNGTLVVYSATEMYLKLEDWTITGGKLPLVDGDKLIIGGKFKHDASGDVLVIEETVVEVVNGRLGINAISVGALGNHGGGAGSDGVHVTMTESNAAFGSDWKLEYAPLSADAYRVIRDGVETNIGQPGRGTLVKFSATEGYIKHSGWCVNEFTPQTSDVFIIEGFWKHTAGSTVIKIDKTYMYHNGTTWVLNTSLPTTVNAGILKTHEAGMSGNGIYFRTEANDAPSNSDWSLEYTQTSVGNIKLIRDGVTTSVGIVGRPLLLKLNECDYYLKLENWTIGQYGLNSTNPITTDDVLIIEGDFSYAAENVILNIERSYIYYDGTAWVCSDTEPGTTPGTGTVINGGNLTEHEEGWDVAGEIFVSMAENDLPVDEEAETEYTAKSGVIKLVRDGNTSELTGTIVKYGATDYYMVLSGDALPLQANDYLIVEGDFANADNGCTLNVAQTYILVDGENLVYSTTEPEVKLTYEVGVLNSHGAGVATGDNGIKGIYATSIATDATSGDWSIEYTPVASENYKLIRDGVTYNVGRPGEGTLAMFGQTEYYLKQETNTFDSSLLPLQKGDILVLEGNWSCNQDAASVITIDTTYILIVGESAVKFSAEMPNVVKINVLKESQNGRGNGFYATADANAAPYDGTWSLRYKAQSADAVKFVTGETTTDVANTSGEMLVKFSDYDYYFEGWTLGDTYANIAEGDMYIVNGLFYNAANDIYLDIDTTYIKFIADDELFGATEPVVIPAYEVGVLASHSAGVNVDATAGIKGIYAVGTATEATYDADWNVDYAPVSSENIQLIRNGETYNVGAPGTRTLILFSQTDYYLDVHDGTITGSLLPLQEGDILVLEGEFSCNKDASSVINITTTYILIGDGTATFSATEPSAVPSAGVLSAHSATSTSTGLYATGAANDAPYDWAAEYAPSTADSIKLIRNGVTYSTGNTGAGTVVKFDTNGYYIKFDSWINGNYPLQAGDIIIIEGVFVGTGNYAEAEGVQLKIDKTFVTYNGTSFTFSESDPRVINVGTMYAQGGANWSGDGINFAVDADNLPYNADWSVEYVPVSNDAIKLIRDGETKNIANTGAGTIVKLGEDNSYLKLEQWMIGDVYPITDGDVLVVEGAFKQSNGDYTMVIDKTYIVIGSVENDEVTFTTQYAETDFGTVILPVSTDTLNIGMWNGSHHVFDHKQLQELQAAGITKIMGVNTQWIGTEDVNAWLDRVYSYGISVIFDLRDWDKTTVPSYANHPGLMGFLMYDEPNANVFDDLAALKAKFDAVMPEGKLFYVNLFPECAADSSLGTEGNWWDSIFGDEKDYDTDYVTAFLNTVGIEVLSWDNYSLITDSSNNEGIRTDYFHNFEVMASKNKPLWYTMLSAGHTAGASDTYYATPTAEELRWQMAVAMTYGVQNIDHYVYTSHEAGYSCMVEYETWNPTALYYDIKTVDNEYLAWDHIFMAYDWQGVGVYDAGSTNKMLSTLENKLNLANYGLTVNSSTQDLLVGVFDHNGDKAYMVTNAGSMGTTTVGDGKIFTTADATVKLTLGSGSYKCAAVIDNGEISYVAVNADNTVTLNVQAYEGVFVIPVLN